MISSEAPKLHFERFEFKYHLNEIAAKKIIDDLLNNNLKWDPYVGEKHDYTVRSLYYESPDFKCYREKLSGIQNRFKIRIRTYSDIVKPGDSVFLEIKRKSDAVILKDRIVLPYDIFQAYFHDRKYSNVIDCLGGHDKDVFKEILAKELLYCMKPLVCVTYKRKPLVGKFQEKLRVTFDSRIEAGRLDDATKHGMAYPIAPNLIIMEVKYNNTLPHWFLKIIQKHNLDRRPFSKYCEGLETCFKHHQIPNFNFSL